MAWQFVLIFPRRYPGCPRCLRHKSSTATRRPVFPHSDAQAAVPLLTNSNIFAPSTAQQSIISGLNAEGATPVPCITTNPANPLMNPLVLPAAKCAFALNSILTVNPNAGVSNAQRVLNPYI